MQGAASGSLWMKIPASKFQSAFAKGMGRDALVAFAPGCERSLDGEDCTDNSYANGLYTDQHNQVCRVAFN